MVKTITRFLVGFTFLLALAGPVQGEQSVTLAWDPNPETDIGGYIVYYGSSSRNYTNAVNVGNVTTNTVRGLVDGATYFFAVTAYNTNGLESDFSDEVSYSSAGGNLPPLVNAGPDITTATNSAIPLRGTATDDGVPNPPATMAFTWSKVSGPGTVTFGSPNSTNTTVTVTVDGTYVLRLTASDAQLSASDTMVLVYNSGNSAPVVNAGPDITATNTTTVVLRGTAVDDGLPNPPGRMTFTWSIISGPGAATFGSPNSTNTTVTVTVDGVYTCNLTASDGSRSASDTVVVTFNGVPPPPSQPRNNHIISVEDD